MSSVIQNEAAALALGETGQAYRARYMIGGTPLVTWEQTVSAAGCIDYLNGRAFHTLADGTTPGTATHAPTKASVELAVSTNADDRAAMVGPITHYEQGGTQTMRITGVFPPHVANTVCEIGPTDWMSTAGQAADAFNGCVLRKAADGTIQIVLRRKAANGGDLVVDQGDWSVDSFDGSGPSKFTMNWENSLILAFRYKHLGYKGVAVGFEVDQTTYIAHVFALSNVQSVPFWNNANLRPTWLLYNTAAPASGSTALATCYQHSVSEGTSPQGTTTCAETGDALVSTTTTETPILAVRLKSDRLHRVVRPVAFAVLSGTAGSNRDVIARLYRGGTLTGGSWSDLDAGNSALEVNTTATGYTAGCAVGAIATAGGSSRDLQSSVLDQLGVDASGTPLVLVLTARTFTGTADVHGAICFEEKT